MARHPSSLMYTIQLNLSCLLLTTQRPAKMNYGEVMRIMAQLSLRLFFGNPRKHSGKGYRDKNRASRGCTTCGDFKTRGIEIRTELLG